MSSDYPQRKHESPFAGDPPPPPISPPQPSKITNPGRSAESASFSIFMAAALLCIGIPFGVWAFWTFQDYRHAANYAQYLRENPNVLELGDKKQNEIIASNQSSADHNRTEALLCAAGSLLLCSGAVFLFVRGKRGLKRAKAAKLNYAPLDLRSIPLPAAPVRVRATVFQNLLLTGLIGFFVLITANNLTQLLRSEFTTTRDLIVKGVIFTGAIIAVIGVLLFLQIRARRQTVRFFDAAGIKRGDGRRFSWDEFRGVIVRTAVNRYGTPHVWRIELALAAGEEAWIIPQRVKNFDEVYKYVDTLPRATLLEEA